ncbi:hypothetical protein BDZ94DRAFT_781360 [Collybia nuda]|uniref:Uncharacterized protein n=1 Tax=Collybia nuda TaxID=64659 RepID=A0A9P6CPT9_9AGAR|nr:hypothetical protein BDZ94DRAFT_781360 [Collybia nuda]
MYSPTSSTSSSSNMATRQSLIRPDYITPEAWAKLDRTVQLNLSKLNSTFGTSQTYIHDPQTDGPREPNPYLNPRTQTSQNDMIIDPDILEQERLGTTRSQPRRGRGRGQSRVPSGRLIPQQTRSRTPSRSSQHQFSRDRSRSPPSQLPLPSMLNEVEKRFDAQLGMLQEKIYAKFSELEREKENRSDTNTNYRGPSKRRGASTAAKRAARRRTNHKALPLPPDDDTREDLRMSKSELSTSAQVAKRCLQKLARNKFRFICGIPKGTNWPCSAQDREDDGDNDENEDFYTPNFLGDVDNVENQEIFAAVAAQVFNDLQNAEDVPDELTNPDHHWDKSTIFEFAKTSFRGFKEEWKKQPEIDPMKAKRGLEQKRLLRWSSRRKEKVKRLAMMVPAYVEEYGVDPTCLLDEKHMSDEASGPEDEDVETKEQWKSRMGSMMGISTPAALMNVRFLETIKPNWRSDELSDIFLTLHTSWWVSLTAKEREGYNFLRVRDTGRASDVIPLLAPFNFGINQRWLEVQKSRGENSHILMDWNTFQDPDGFGEGVEADALGDEFQPGQ